MKLLERIMSFFGFVPKAKYIELSEEAERYFIQNFALNAQVETYQKKLDSIESKTIDEWREEVEKAHKDIAQAEEFYMQIQQVISLAMKDDERFKFEKAPIIIPGTNLLESKVEDGIVHVNLRMVMNDQDTAVLQTYSSIYDKHRFVAMQMRRYGLMEQIIKRMIDSGALRILIGYDKDRTVCEAFIEISMVQAENIFEEK